MLLCVPLELVGPCVAGLVLEPPFNGVVPDVGVAVEHGEFLTACG